MKNRFLMISACCLFACAGAVHASVLATDSFETYATGSLNGDNGGTGAWASSWKVSSTVGADYTAWVNVVNRSMSYDNGSVHISGGSKAVAFTPTSATPLVVFGRSLTSATSTVYMSFLIQAPTVNTVNSTNTTDDFFQTGFDNAMTFGTSGDVHASTGISKSSDGNNKFFARNNTSSGGNTNFSTTINTSATYFLVLKVSKSSPTGNYDRVNLFINPTSAVEADQTSLDALGSTTMSSITSWLFRSARVEDGDVYYLDNFTYADTFASAVAPPVPEPATMSLLALGGLALLRRRR